MQHSSSADTDNEDWIAAIILSHPTEERGWEILWRKTRLGEKSPETLRPRSDSDGWVTNSVTERSATLVNFFVDKYFQNIFFNYNVH